MAQVKGTIGYGAVVEKYAKVTEEISFEILHKAFLKFIPTKKSLVMDIGAGTGRDAYELSLKGHTVLAIEPLAAFRTIGQELYKAANLNWVDDALPQLAQLEDYENKIDFVLCSSVWHHFREDEQELAMLQISKLLKPNGILALSLRNGPAGVGTHVFPANHERTISIVLECGMDILLELANQPSLLKNKEQVKWSRLVIQKTSRKGNSS